MTSVTTLRAAEPRLPEVTGYVEAATADRLVGWAWAPASPDQRVRIELRLGETIVARTVADLPRADLLANGVGDGRHAYEVAVPPEFRSRAAELRVFAQLGDKPATPIGAPPAAEELSAQVGKLMQGMDVLVNSQRVMHRNLQAALTGRTASQNGETEAILAKVADLQATTAEQMSVMERFVVRLDEQLAKLSDKPAQEAVALPKAALWALAVASVALVVSVAGLIHSLVG